VKIDESYYLTKMYFKKGKKGFNSVQVTGERRIGKSVFCMQVIAQICLCEGASEENAWLTALNAMTFSMEDLVKTIKRHSYNNRRKFLVWDDSGVYGSGLLYRYNQKHAPVLKALMDTVGTRVRLLMLTTPNSDSLMSFLRKYGDTKVHLTEYHNTFGKNGRLVTIRRPYTRKNLAIGYFIAKREEIDIRVPDWVFNKYVKMRDKYADIIINKMGDYGEAGKQVVRQTYGQRRSVVR